MESRCEDTTVGAVCGEVGVKATAMAVCVMASRRRSSTHTTVTHPRRRMSCSADFGSMEDSRREGKGASVVELAVEGGLRTRRS